ncbi:preprotein translocase subunit SecE [Leekyejoonella antrihumi]|uniref:preprotein translocase subunit SecE n=1 Tax=Leekyejoonella antrihumi TaxID=1660198 RepID=UPI001647FDDC|nr:preprotein translocase subunit SecE [Leekyejoonella antrihumi]
MTDTRTTAGRGAARGPSAKGHGRVGVFAKISLYLRQVIDEMRKVARPTRDQLVDYTLVVIAFLVVVMAYVVGLDQLFQRLVSWAFAG